MATELVPQLKQELSEVDHEIEELTNTLLERRKRIVSLLESYGVSVNGTGVTRSENVHAPSKAPSPIIRMKGKGNREGMTLVRDILENKLLTKDELRQAIRARGQEPKKSLDQMLYKSIRNKKSGFFTQAGKYGYRPPKDTAKRKTRRAA